MARRPRSRRRRIFRRVVLGLVGVIIVAIASALIVVHTDWGRNKIRGAIVAAMAKPFPCGVTIGALEGSVVGDAVIRDVVIKDCEGRPAISIARIGLNLKLTSLITKTIRLEDLRVSGVRIDAHKAKGGGLNLVELLHLSPEPLGWAVALDNVHVTEAAITTDIHGRVDHIDDLDIAGSLFYGRDQSVRTAATIGGQWKELKSRLGVQLEGVRIAEAITASSIKVSLDGIAQLDVNDLRYVSTTDATATATIAIAEDAVQRVWPDRSNPKTTVTLAIRPLDPGWLGGELTALAGDRQIHGGAAFTPSGPLRIAGGVSVAAIDARLFAPRAVETNVAASVGFWLTVDTDAIGVSGVVAAVASGTIDDYTVAHAGVTAILGGRELYAFVDAAGDDKRTATVRARGHLALAADGSVTIDHGRLDAHAKHLEQVAPIVGVSGEVDANLDVTASFPAGAPVALTLDGRVVGRGVRRGRIHAQRVEADLRSAVIDFGQPDKPRGGATVVVTGGVVNDTALPTVTVTADSQARGGGYQVAVTSSGDHLGPTGPWAIELGAVVHPGEDYHSATIDLGDYTVRTNGVPWTGHGGTVIASADKVEIDKVAGTIERGRFAVDGTLHPGSLAIDGTISLVDVDLAQVDRAFGLTARGIGPLHGNAAFTAELHHHGKLPSSIHGEVRGLMFNDHADPLDLAIDATITPTRVAGRVTATSQTMGGIAITADVAPPRDLTNVLAWARLERRAIRSLAIEATDVDIVALTRALGGAPPLEGKVSATVALDAQRSVAEIHLHDVVSARLPGLLDIDATLDLVDPALVVVDAHATVREIGRAAITGTIRVPTRPFDLAAWQRLDVTSVVGGTIAVEEITINDGLATRFGLGSVRGRVAGTLVIAEAMKQISAHVTALGVTGGPVRRPIDLTLDGMLDGRGATATVTGSVDGAPILTAEATAPIDTDQLTAAALRKVPITGTATIHPTRVDTLIRALGTGRAVDGMLAGSATFSGTVGDPGGTATIAITNLGGKRAKIKRIAVDASYAAGKLTAKLDAIQEGGGGTLVATATYDRAHPEAATATVKADVFQLSPIVILIPDLLGVRGIFDADLRMHGADPKTATIEGMARIQKATIPIIDEIGAITDGSLGVSFHAGHAHLALDGSIESGDVELTADAELDGLLPRKATIDASFRDIAIINTIAPRLAAQLHAVVELAGDRWNVVAQLSKARVVIPDEEGKALHPASPPSDMVFVEHGAIKMTPRVAINRWLGRRPTHPFLRIGLQIEPVSIVSKQLRGEVSGRLDILVGDDGISIDGDIEAKRGEVTVFERRYLLSRAAVAFDGGLDPELDIQMSHDFAELAMTVGVRGRLSHPELELSSDPSGYTEGQLLGFLLGGSPGGQGGDSKDALTGAAAAVATQTLGGFVTKKLPVKIDVFRYEPATTSSSAAFTVGKWVTAKLLVLIRSRIEPREDENTGETELEYWLGRRVLLDAVGGDKAVLGLDLLWTRRW